MSGQNGVTTHAHFEPFVHLVDVDDDQALIAWGGFWFVPFDDGHGMRIVDDERLGDMEAGRLGSIGLDSEPYGHPVVSALSDFHYGRSRIPSR